MTYRVRFCNDITKEVFCVMDFETNRFTKREYDIIIRELYSEATFGIENRSLFADVFCGATEDLSNVPFNKLGLITIACESTTDGERIDAHIFVNCNHVRNMNIAC